MNPDDPKFTAHVLGESEELTPAERTEIEALLNGDPEAMAEADELRALAARLRAELPGEEAGALDAVQRAAVFAAAGTAPTTPVQEKVLRFPRRVTVLAALAACVVVGVSIAVLFPIMQAEKDAARKSLAATGTPAPQEFAMVTNLPTAMAERPLEEAGKIAPAAAPAAPIAAAMPTPPAAEPPVLATSPKIVAALTNSGVAVPTFAPDMSKVTPLEANRGMPVAAIQAMPKDAMSKSLTVSRSASPTAGVPASPFMATVVADLAPASRAAGMPARAQVAQSRYRMTLAENESDVERGGALPFEDRLAPEAQAGVSFEQQQENGFLTVRANPLSTFSIDVDTASYAMVRRFLNHNQAPPKGAVRIEELLNYFSYDYAPPQGDAPFSAAMEVAACPWAPDHRLVRIALKGREIARDKRPASNLVFLIDVSGSMQPDNKLPLLKQSLGLLIDQLGEEDQVAIVVYAGSSGCVLEPTSDKRKMHAALGRLEAGGSTNGGSGLQLAYKLAEQRFIKGGTNRVILATDGDWNVGITDRGDLLGLIKRKAKTGVFLTVLGVGMDNLKDDMLVKLADSGNGNYAYLDTVLEARKVLVEQLSGTLVTIAKDVKIQVEFNPAQVGAYRLIGYEKRMLAKQDFNDDKKDAGEIGAGHTVTALYEIMPEPLVRLAQQRVVDPLKYQSQPQPPPEATDPSAPQAPVPTPRSPRPLQRAPMDAKPYLLDDNGKPIVEAPKGGEPEQAVPTDVIPAAKVKGAPISQEMLTLKLRYKDPEGDTSKLLEFPLTDRRATWEQSSKDFRFAAAVAGYGMLLRDSQYKGETTWSAVAEWAAEGKGKDASGYRAEFLGLLEKARAVCR